MCLFILIVISLKITKLIPRLFCDYLRNGGDIFMICQMIFRNVNAVSVRTWKVLGGWFRKFLFLMNGS